MDYLNEIVCGDCLEILKTIPDNSINTIITSPPYYSQRDYKNGDGKSVGNEKDIEDYINSLLLIFKECVRIIKEDGSVFFNIGDKYKESSLLLAPYRFGIEAAKLKDVYLINQITWVKPNPQPRQFKGRLVSSTEPIFHFTKNLKFKYYPDKFMCGNNVGRGNKVSGNNIGMKYFDLIAKSDLSAEQKKRVFRV
jgi:site-specific DNA-methyltransferase (adenine-specific)